MYLDGIARHVLTSHAVLISRSSRLRRHCCFDRAREPLFEIDDADPFRADADPQHLREHLLRLTDPRLTLLFPKVSLGTRDILGNDPSIVSVFAVPRICRTL